MPSSHLKFSLVKFKPSPGSCQDVWWEFAKDLQFCRDKEPRRRRLRPMKQGENAGKRGAHNGTGGLSVENGSEGGRLESVWLYSDGTYRWAYERDLVRNRFETNYVLRVIMLVFGLSWAVFMGIMLTVDMGRSGPMVFGITTGICLGGGLVTVGILRLAHIASARYRGGVEVIGFAMNEEGLRQIHYEGTQSAGEVMDRLALATPPGSIRGVGQTQPNGFGVTLFSDVRRMELHSKYDLIDLTLKGNYKCRVYVRKEDFDFVRDYIGQRIR